MVCSKLWLSLSCQPDDDERRKAGRGQGGQWPCRGLGQQALSSPTVSTLFIVDHPPLCPQYIPHICIIAHLLLQSSASTIYLPSQPHCIELPLPINTLPARPLLFKNFSSKLASWIQGRDVYAEGDKPNCQQW